MGFNLPNAIQMPAKTHLNRSQQVNPNQRGMPASTKEGALKEKIQLAEGGGGFSRQKRLTLRDRLIYLQNSDHF